MRLLHVVEFSKKLRWLAQTKVITLKIQLHAINANVKQLSQLSYKLRCDEHFMHAFTACACVFKEITLVDSNQCNYFENVTECSKRTLKTTVATQLKELVIIYINYHKENVSR